MTCEIALNKLCIEIRHTWPLLNFSLRRVAGYLPEFKRTGTRDLPLTASTITRKLSCSSEVLLFMLGNGTSRKTVMSNADNLTRLRDILLLYLLKYYVRKSSGRENDEKMALSYIAATSWFDSISLKLRYNSAKCSFYFKSSLERLGPLPKVKGGLSMLPSKLFKML